MKKFCTMISALLVISAFVSCNDKEPDYPPTPEPPVPVGEMKTVKGVEFTDCFYEGYKFVELQLSKGEEVSFTGFQSLENVVQMCFWDVKSHSSAVFNAPDGRYSIYLNEKTGLLYTEYPLTAEAPQTYWIGGEPNAYGHPKGGKATGSWDRILPENRICMVQTAPGIYETDAFLAGAFQFYSSASGFSGINRNSVSGIFLDGVGTAIQSTNENFSIPKGKGAGVYHIVLETRFARRLMLEQSVKSQEVTFMTFNIAGLVLTDVSQTAKVIRDSGADVIGCQEVLNTPAAGNQLEQICKQAGYSYNKFCITRSEAGGYFGNGIISKEIPISTREVFLKCNLPNGEDRKALIVEYGNYYICVTHLSQGVATGSDAWEKDEKNRITQINTLISELSKLTDKPVFFMADFNSQPIDSAGQEIQKTSFIFKNDLYAQNTYPSNDPTYRLDYVCQLKTGFVAIQTRGEVINTQVSDHRPVVVGLRFYK